VEVRDEALLFQVIRAAFGQRRKTLLNALYATFGSQCSKAELSALLAVCGLPEGVRGERLDLAQFAALSNGLCERINTSHP
jgi:16S rRNA (adenine1518-N6/adenine1519-N6)-dimethyltransferase